MRKLIDKLGEYLGKALGHDPTASTARLIAAAYAGAAVLSGVHMAWVQDANWVDGAVLVGAFISGSLAALKLRTEAE